MNLMKLKKSQIQKASELCARAYHSNEFFKYLIPKDEERYNKLVAIFKVRIKFGMLCGNVFTTSDNIEAIAQWIPSNKSKYTFSRILRVGAITLLFRLGNRCFSNLLKMGSECDEIPRNLIKGNYMSLLSVAVDPKYQGKGYASKLLKPMMQELDKKKLMSALETPTLIYVKVYEHFGYEMIEEKVLISSNNKVKMWFMKREPKK